MIDFTQIKPEEILLKKSIKKYEKQLDFFWNELTYLNTYIFFIKKISRWPIFMFCNPGEQIFFSFALWSFFENSILIITKLKTDQGNELIKLLEFKNWVVINVKKKYRSDFRTKLRKSKFDKKTEEIFDKAKNLRNYVFAHYHKYKLNKIPTLNYTELDILYNKLYSLFDILSFGVEHVMLPFQYFDNLIHQTETDNRSTIDHLFDSLVKNSAILNLPKEEPMYWNSYKEKLDEKEIKIINEYRKKFNFPEV